LRMLRLRYFRKGNSMLKIVLDMAQLPVNPLMAICTDALQRDAKDRYGDLPPGIGLEYAELDLKEYLREVFFREKGAYYALWEENGKYVSALRMIPYSDGLLLHSLHTHPDQRRKGYAASLIRAVLAREGDKKVYSHVKKENLPSILLHEKMGFRKTAACAVYLDGSWDENSLTFCREKQGIWT